MRGGVESCCSSVKNERYVQLALVSQSTRELVYFEGVPCVPLGLVGLQIKMHMYLSACARPYGNTPSTYLEQNNIRGRCPNPSKQSNKSNDVFFDIAAALWSPIHLQMFATWHT